MTDGLISIKIIYMRNSYSCYHARCWATGRTINEIKEEINHCEARYLKPYPWNGTEFAQNTISRIAELNDILVEMQNN